MVALFILPFELMKNTFAVNIVKMLTVLQPNICLLVDILHMV